MRKVKYVIVDADLCSGEKLNSKNVRERGTQCNCRGRGGFLQSAQEGRIPAMRMLGNSLPQRGNRKCKDELIFPVL